MLELEWLMVLLCVCYLFGFGCWMLDIYLSSL